MTAPHAYLPLVPVAVPITVSVILAFAARSKHRRAGDKDIFELPPLLAYVMASVGVVFLALPFVPKIGGAGPTPVYFYAWSDMFSAGAFAAAVWFVRYRVTVGPAAVAVRRLLWERVIQITDIINSDLLVGRQARELVIYLKDGHRVRLSGLLQDFDELVDAIRDAQTSDIDSAQKLADQRRVASGNRSAAWITTIGLVLVAAALIAARALGR